MSGFSSIWQSGSFLWKIFLVSIDGFSKSWKIKGFGLVLKFLSFRPCAAHLGTWPFIWTSSRINEISLLIRCFLRRKSWKIFSDRLIFGQYLKGLHGLVRRNFFYFINFSIEIFHKLPKMTQPRKILIVEISKSLNFLLWHSLNENLDWFQWAFWYNKRNI